MYSRAFASFFNYVGSEKSRMSVFTNLSRRWWWWDKNCDMLPSPFALLLVTVKWPNDTTLTCHIILELLCSRSKPVEKTFSTIGLAIFCRWKFWAIINVMANSLINYIRGHRNNWKSLKRLLWGRSLLSQVSCEKNRFTTTNNNDDNRSFLFRP